ncbi:hypothetical protein [Mycobacterium colombiense]|uniref:hypothetical protein n=1 Tax=Mycobacterium colombiense TaxID=339268 RepID=UPI000AFDD85C|nr:hypothetical protein [Mycobacterium colombiense]
MDEDTLLNAVHVPTDAGTYAEALQRIPCRIPHGWCVRWTTPVKEFMRWISHDAGWYPIVAILDNRVARSSCATTAHPAASRAPNCGRHHRRSRTRVHHHLRTRLRPIRDPARAQPVTQNAVRLKR